MIILIISYIFISLCFLSNSFVSCASFYNTTFTFQHIELSANLSNVNCINGLLKSISSQYFLDVLLLNKEVNSNTGELLTLDLETHQTNLFTSYTLHQAGGLSSIATTNNTVFVTFQNDNQIYSVAYMNRIPLGELKGLDDQNLFLAPKVYTAPNMGQIFPKILYVIDFGTSQFYQSVPPYTTFQLKSPVGTFKNITVAALDTGLNGFLIYDSVYKGIFSYSGQGSDSPTRIPELDFLGGRVIDLQWISTGFIITVENPLEMYFVDVYSPDIVPQKVSDFSSSGFTHIPGSLYKPPDPFFNYMSTVFVINEFFNNSNSNALFTLTIN